MFRTSRSIAILIRHLVLGTVATVATATVATSLVSCADESQPKYWVKKLEDPKWRPAAIKRLDQFYQDALTKAGNDPKKPEVQALLNEIAEPLTKAYVEGYATLDTKTRVSLIKLIAMFRDPRTEPAIKKALEEFAKKPTEKREEEDIKWAIRAQTDLQLAGVQGAVLDTFMKLKASSMLGGITYKDLNACMLAKPEKSWAEPMKKLLEADVPDPKKDPQGNLDQQFWQTVSAQVLGDLRDESAIEPLMKAILDPGKGPIATTALLALVKIGKPERAIKLLNGEEPKLAEYHIAKLMKLTGAKEPPKDKPEMQMAAAILGMMGQRSALQPMIDAMTKVEEKSSKAVILAELVKIPATDASKTAFKTVFEGLDLDVTLPPRGGKAMPDLVTEAVPKFYDPEMVEWLIARGEETRGSEEDLKDLRSAILVTMFKLGKPEHLDKMKEYLEKWGVKNTDAKSKFKYFESQMFDLSADVLKACGEKVPCYLTTLESAESQAQDTQFKGIKCAYMAAIYGDDKTVAEFIKRLPSIENASVRFAAASAIDHLLPNGSLEVADQLEKIIEANLKTADPAKIQGDSALKQVMYRIRARAQK